MNQRIEDYLKRNASVGDVVRAVAAITGMTMEDLLSEGGSPFADDLLRYFGNDKNTIRQLLSGDPRQEAIYEQDLKRRCGYR